jgi:tetratricopeptide (TPR) repeat protein
VVIVEIAALFPLTDGVMSYINDALRKAQKERDGRYERFSGIITPGLSEPGQPQKRRLAIAAAIVLFSLVAAGLLLTLYILYQPSSTDKGIKQPVAAENPAAFPFATRQGASATVQGGTAPREAPAEVRYKEALFAQRNGDHKRAEVLYGEVLALDPDHVRALNNLGVLYMAEQKEEEKAIALFGKAIVLKRDYVDPYYNLACLYARKNKIDESLWYLRVAMTISDDVKNWVLKDVDLKSVVASSAFKKIMEGQKN